MKKIVSIVIILVSILIMNIIYIEDKQNTTYAAGYKSYYVSIKTGRDYNPGSMSKPFKSIQKALNVVKAGDTIYVRGGVYKELLNVRTSGKASAKIKILNYPYEKPIIDGTGKSAGSSSYFSLLTISNKSYITISGFELRNLTTKTTALIQGISIRGSGTDIKIKNCKIHNIKTLNSSQLANGHGISVYGTKKDKPYNNVILEGNEVYNCVLGQSESVAIKGNVTNFKVLNNKVHNNDNIGIAFIGYDGTAGGGATDRARQGVCAGNVVYNISGVNNPSYLEACADGIYVDGGQNIIIDRNIVTSCDIGIEAASEHKGKSTQNITIRNNLVTYCNGFGAISFGGAGIWTGDATNIKIINNTIYRSKIGVSIQRANSGTNVVANNIIYRCDAKIDGWVRKNNVYNNWFANPYFVSPSKGNYRLKSYSPAINKGVRVDYGVFDLDLETRVSGNVVDMGCYEY